MIVNVNNDSVVRCIWLWVKLVLVIMVYLFSDLDDKEKIRKVFLLDFLRLVVEVKLGKKVDLSVCLYSCVEFKL